MGEDIRHIVVTDSTRRLFEEIWPDTDVIPGSFTDTNGLYLFNQAMLVPSKGVVVEVGVDQGRSASLLLHAATYTLATVILIDSWESVLIDNKRRVTELCNKFKPVNSFILHMTSERAINHVIGPIDFIHIDANHTEEFVNRDCELWLPQVKSKGVACFHDYDMSGVRKAVDRYTANWENLGNYDNLAIRRKI